jgi:coenzyme PQQ precursor peptide PqqA
VTIGCGSSQENATRRANHCHIATSGGTTIMDKQNHWERPDFSEVPLGAEVTAYLGTDSSL